MTETLRKYHTVKGLGSLTSIYQKMMHTQKKDDISIETHIKTIRQYGDLLESFGEPILPVLIIACIFSTLPAGYKPVITALNGDPQGYDVLYVTARLQNFAITEFTNNEDNLPNATALAANRYKPYVCCPVSEITCFRCRKCGHYQSSCPKPVETFTGAALTPMDTHVLSAEMPFSTHKVLPF
ncbi:hypothetical protein BT96DRAFT_989250 [Gymnopus androsaceus JB14]|uniref:CCHC-type domain-containing protein n=1 Tax=Gymnopus androsaceus JB14 TaxID=1447944 RepID=A0A6A4HYE2_9AGAR|nr:hypothetical protein BT96DRAFT_989250 [Gymnopus androsaceus JB14]